MSLPMRMNTTAMAMTHTATTTITDADLLGLMWLASPALPVGGFSYSEGLEAAVESGFVKDEATSAQWLVHQLHLTLARSDLAIVAQAVTAWRANDEACIAQLDDWVLRTRETGEMRQQSEQMGRSMGEWLKTILPDTAVQTSRPWTYPVAFALAASRSTAPVRAVLLSFAFGWAENMVQAAIKSIPLGQSAGQRMLAALAADIPAAVDHAMALADDDRQAFSPILAILSSQHETQYSRLFRS